MRGYLVLSTTTTMSNHQLRQSPSNILYKPPSTGDNLKSQSDPSPASLSVQESSRSTKRQVTKYHSHSRSTPQILPSRAQESSFHPTVPKTAPCHACNTLPSRIRYLDAIETKNSITSLFKTMTNTNSYVAIKRAEKEGREGLAVNRA